MKQIEMKTIYKLIFLGAILIMLYPYISHVLYTVLGDDIYGSKIPEAVVGRPSPFNNVTLDIKNFNISLFTFKKFTFKNVVSPIVITTAIANIIYIPIALKFFYNKNWFVKIAKIPIIINSILAISVIIIAYSIWIVNF